MEKDNPRTKREFTNKSTAFPTRVAVQPRTLLVYAHALGADLFGLRRIHSFLDIGCEIIKRFLDVDVVLS